MKIETIEQIAKKLGKQERTLEKPSIILNLLKAIIKK